MSPRLLQISDMKKTTAGEKLFYLIRDELIDLMGVSHARWSNLELLFELIGGDAKYAGYVKGAVTVHLIRRLLRFWEVEKRLIADESLYVRKMADFIKREVFPGLDASSVSLLSRAVIRAEAASFKPIKPQVKANVIGERKAIRCYLCNRELDKKAKEKDESYLTFEHLWPTSIGGDSIEDNLLPACKRCQKVTKDTASWEWLNVHNLVLPSSPSDEALISVSHPVRFAKHYLEAIRLADESQLSLKDSFVRLGPMSHTLTHLQTGLPITFFDLRTV
jgi:hypothetical protein